MNKPGSFEPGLFIRYSALGASRTHDLRFRKPMLYPLSYERVLGNRYQSIIAH